MRGVSLLTKMYEIGSMTGLSQKRNSFSSMASTNCQTGGEASDDQYFEQKILYHFHKINMYFLNKNSDFIFPDVILHICQ